MCSQQLSVLHSMNNSLISKIYFHNYFPFKNYSLVEVIYLLSRCNKTKFFLWNTNNTDRNDVNKQKNTHTKHWKGLVSRKISDIHLFKTTPYLTNPPFYEKNLNAIPAPHFAKISIKKAVPTMKDIANDNCLSRILINNQCQ